jgi:hypothetical protein
MKFERPSQPKPPPIMCAGCQRATGSNWFHDGKWFCRECIKAPLPLPLCKRCGKQTTLYGIEQFAIGSMGSDAYGFEQGLGAVCPDRHVTLIGQQWGPGAKNAGEAIA